MEQQSEIIEQQNGTRVVYRVRDKHFKTIREIVETYDGELQDVLKEVKQQLERPTTWITLHPEEEEETHYIIKVKDIVDVEVYTIC